MENDCIDDEYSVEHGTVIDVRSGEIVVRVEKNDADCGGCRSCAMKALCRGRDAGHLDLPVPLDNAQNPRPEKGQRVRVAYRPTNAAVAGLVMFVPPLLGLLFGGLAGHGIQGAGDAALLAGCFIGLAAGIGVSYVLARAAPSLKPDVKLLSVQANP